jgi:hypothetical protein
MVRVERRGRSISPEILEPVRSQRRVDGRACDRPVPEPSLDGAGVVALIGERVPAGMAEHVRVRLKLKAGGTRCPLDHPGEAGGRERRSPLADKDKRRGLALPLEPAQGPELVAAQGVGARGAVLDPPHMQHRRI